MQIQIRRPDDWHLHLRDGAAMAAVLPHTAARFARAIVMPNLKPPVTSTEAAGAYRDRILAALPPDDGKRARFAPLMTLYLTDLLQPGEIDRAKASGFVHACKLYPAGATTNSDSGVTDIRRLDLVLERMSAAGMPLLVHGEVTGRHVDVFDREARFIDEVLAPTVDRFPALRIVFEHITTARAAEFVTKARDGVAATITPQHLLHNRNAIFEGGIRPHYYCLPILKTEPDREALVAAATSGNPRFFLGTDSAPHAQHTKENACGCAGMYSAHAGIELYAEAFDAVGKIDKLEGFASDFGADFYRLPRNADKITLVKREWRPPASYAMGDGKVVPMRAGEPIAWELVS
jgi:dihydroorotase